MAFGSQPTGVRRLQAPATWVEWMGVRALVHPVTLAAIAALLLNDHLLKRLTPGTLTGKLSDFAGLLFFPMVLIVVLGRITGCPRPRRLMLAVASFIASGAVFATLKAVPQANAAAHALAAGVLGLRLQMALDPSDLWALTVLPAAFTLWLRAESNPSPVPLRAGLLALSVATLAAVATAPCPPEQPISRLLQGSNGLYAVARAWEPFSGVYRSRDEGRTWEFLQEEDVPPQIAAQVEQPVVYPVIACDPGTPRLCYRIDGQQPQVERSEDGGQTWDVAWSPPAVRLSYMRRVAAGTGKVLACGKEIDFSPHDLMLLPSGGGSVVLVALGNEGVLRGPADRAVWERFGVGWAEATPERGSSLHDLWPPSTILTETLLLLAAGASAFLVLSVRTWTSARRRPDASGEGYRWFWWAAGGVLALVVVAAVVAGVEELLPMLGIPLALILAYVAFLGQRWSIAIEDSLEVSAVQRCLWLSLAASFGSAALAWLFFALWVFGIVPVHSLALALALGSLLAGWLLGWRAVSRAFYPAAAEQRLGV